MTLAQLFERFDRSDLEWAHSIDRESLTRSAREKFGVGIWLVDAKTHKKLSGPFVDKSAAERFKKNRPDLISSTALIKTM